ncbi:MAG: lipid A deacylase LpxR family protein [Parvibaculum sp.]|jgi:hypothetical protein|uniref:lipid A deacylase LpxR family protein n=1 Tax=Parvibaculum sp. TaxID=2024848 RepID=UPI00284F6120|nr:lipid A deacylase LpxR family protein [Parvibaculum sp.]MDR3498261.1 lipid A deacylase LpxR family protein [Parvibaculum sp.]
MTTKFSTLSLAGVICGLALAAGSETALASDPVGSSKAADQAFLTLGVDNDFFEFANLDQHYTNGLKASWLSAPRDDLPAWLTDAIAPPTLSSGAVSATSHRLGVSLSQEIFTPADTTVSAPQPDDRPYAAWLHMTFALVSIREAGTEESWQDKWKVDLGVVGPAALGEQVQNGWHRFIGVEQAKGWGNQIHNEPALGLTFERAWRSASLTTPAVLGFDTDFIPYGVVTVGNVRTYAGVGATLRIGPSLPDDFGPTGIYPDDGGSEWFSGSGGLDWYLFAGASMRGVARDIFLDGNTFRSSASIDKRPVVADLKAGFVAVVWDTRIAFTDVYRTKEFYGQVKPDLFGSISLTRAF